MESRDRNFIIQKVHNVRLPSYGVWTEDDLYRVSFPIKKKWWEDMDTICKKKGIEDLDIKHTIRKWIEIFTLDNEYCPKRTGASDI